MASNSAFNNSSNTNTNISNNEGNIPHNNTMNLNHDNLHTSINSTTTIGNSNNNNTVNRASNRAAVNENRMSSLSISSNSSSNSSINTMDEAHIHESPPNSLRLDLVEGDVALGTPREERLVSKLKVIDVVSQNSDESGAGSSGLTLDAPVGVSNLIPLNSPTLPGTSSSAAHSSGLSSEGSSLAHGAGIGVQVGGANVVVVSQPSVNSVRPRVPTETATTSYNEQQVARPAAATVYPYPQHAHGTSMARQHEAARRDGVVRQPNNRITLLVGGIRFTVNSQLFTTHPNTMLGRMFSTGMEYLKVNESGEYEVARGISGNVFKIVMEYYKTGSMHCPPTVSMAELREACDYLLIPFNAEIIKCQNLSELLHEVSNDGSREKFTSHFMEEIILPKILECARRGNRECHLVILKEEDIVEWGDFKPNNGEEYAEIVHNTNLYRFFKYFENRDVAKDVLTERGLKKVKLGIEGFPTHMEKVKYKVHSKPDVIYSYIQRPFVHMSWEKEGSKSRHVDFQCVKPSKQSGVFGAVDEPAALAPDLDLPPPEALLGGEEFPHTDNPDVGE